MGLRDWFSSIRRPFGAGVPVDSSPRWFGKLPTYNDYLRRSDEPAWAHEFADWLINGFSQWQAAHPSASHTAMPESWGAIRLPKAGTTVGFVHRDHGGDSLNRPFGFAFFAALPSPAQGPFAFDLLSLAATVDRFREAHDELTRQPAQPGEMSGRFAAPSDEAIAAEAVAAGLDHSSPPSVGDWFESLRPAVQPPEAEQWFGRLYAWGEQISANASAEFTPTMRFPVSRRWSWKPQVTAWLEWVRRRLPSDVEGVGCLLTRSRTEDRPDALTVVGNRLRPSDFGLLTDAAAVIDYLDEAGELTRVQASDRSLPTAWSELARR